MCVCECVCVFVCVSERKDHQLIIVSYLPHYENIRNWSNRRNRRDYWSCHRQWARGPFPIVAAVIAVAVVQCRLQVQWFIMVDVGLIKIIIFSWAHHYQYHCYDDNEYDITYRSAPAPAPAPE